MTCKIKDHTITCTRKRDPLRHMNGVVTDRQKNDWYITLSKTEFERLPDMYPVEAYDENGKQVKKFVRNFLQFKKELREE